MGQLLSQAGQLPSQMGGQLSGLLSPALSAAGGGFGGGGTPGLGVPGLGAAGGPWSGLGGGSGGFAGGGSPVSAALTKPSAGAGMTGSVGMPSAWWATTPTAPISPPPECVALADRWVPGRWDRACTGCPAALGREVNARTAMSLTPIRACSLATVSATEFRVYTDDGVVYVQGQGV